MVYNIFNFAIHTYNSVASTSSSFPFELYHYVVPSWHVQKWLAYILFSSLIHFYVEHVKILASNVEYIFPNQPLYVSVVLSLNNILIYYLLQHPIFVILLLQILQQLIPFPFDLFQCLDLYLHIIFLFIWIEELHLCCVYLFFFYS